MASIGKEGSTKRILFYAPDGKRKTIRLGKCSQRQAEAVCLRVERLAAAKLTGHSPDDETSRWLAEIDEALHGKLAKAGLVVARTSVTLDEFINGYIASRADLKDRTRELLEKAGENLVKMFGAGNPLRDFTEGDADSFRQSLLNGGLAVNTVRRRCGRAKQFFKAAMRQRLILSNPFEGIACNVNENRSRFYFVSRDDAEKVLEACPDHEWRVLFALARYGGLRCPSETLNLRWENIDWQNQKMDVPSPKTEHHAGRESRLVPIFPELLPHLELAFDRAEDGAEFVISRYRSQNVNLRTQLHKIIRRAGLEPWGKPWQNLRSTRETELVETFPVHVAAAWLGNTEAVANKHYLQVTGEHFKKALEPVATVRPEASSAARNPARYTSELPVIAGNQKDEPREIPLNSAGFQPVPSSQLPRLDSNQGPSG